MSVNSYAIIPNKFELFDLINIINKEADNPIENFRNSDSNTASIYFKFKGNNRMAHVVYPHPEYGVEPSREHFYLGDNISISLGSDEDAIQFFKKFLEYTEGYLIECDARDEDSPDYVKFCERKKDDFVIEKTPEEKLLTSLSIINPQLITKSELFNDKEVFEKVVEHFKDYIDEKENTPTPKM